MDNSNYPPEGYCEGNENGLTPEAIRDEVNRLADEVSEGFPLEVYPDEVREIICDAERFLQFPTDFTAASILIATAAAIGNTYSAKPYPAPFKPLASFFLCLVGSPGIGKTHPLSFALKPLKAKDDEFYIQYEEQMKCRKAWERLNKKEREQTQEPEIPTLRRFVLNDATPEAIIRDHRDNPRGLVIHVDELSGWVSSFERYNKGADVELYLSLWSGQPITVSRKTSDPVRVPQPCVNVTGTTQPRTLSKFMLGFDENGMLQRFLFVMPNDLKKPKWSSTPPPADIQSNWSRILCKLADERQAITPAGIPLPKELDWTDDARNAILNWQHNTTERLNSTTLDEVKERFAKLETYLPRFALVLHLLDCATASRSFSTPISGKAVQGAIQLVRYFDREAEKVLNLIRESNQAQRMNATQRRFFERLPNEFTTQEAVKIALGLDIPQRTTEDWLSKSDWFERIQHGKYKKRF